MAHRSLIPSTAPRAVGSMPRLAAMCLIAFTPCIAPAVDVTSTWDGSTNLWTSDHWDNEPDVPHFPNNGNGGNTYDAVLNGGWATLDQSITLRRLTLANNGPAITVNAPYNLTVNEQFDWSRGYLVGTGQVTIPSTGVLNISTAAGTVNLETTLTNNGTTNWTGGSNLQIYDGVLNNYGSFNASVSGPVAIASGGPYTAIFNNIGNYTVSASRSVEMTHSVALNNSGTVTLQPFSVLSLYGGGVSTGTFTGAGGALLRIGENANYLLESAANINGALNVEFSNWSGTTLTSNAAINITGNFSLGTNGNGPKIINGPVSAGNVDVSAGVITFNNSVSATGTLFAISTTDFNGPVSAGRLDLPNGTATFNSSLTAANGDIYGGTIAGSANWNVTGTLNWSRGIMQSGAQTTIATGATLNMSGVNLYRTLVNNGITNWSYFANNGVSSHGVLLYNGTFQNNNTFIANGTAADPIYMIGWAGTTNVFNNAGTFTKIGNGSAAFTDPSYIDVPFNNTGTVDIQAGTLTLGPVSQHSGSQLTGGTWRVHNGTTLDFSRGTSITTNLADVTLDGPTSTFAKINTLVDNKGSFSILNGRNFTVAGAFSNTGTLTVGSGSAFTATSLSQLSSGELTAGTLNVTGMLSVGGPNIVTNRGSVTLDGPTSAFNQINSLVDNRGTFAVLNGRDFTATGAFNNYGTLNVGELSTFTASSGLTHHNGATLKGKGKLITNLVSSGRVAPGNSPGIITIQGDYTQTATGTLEIEVGGLIEGDEHDKLVVTGDAYLDGRLEVPLVNNFVPTVGDEITFLTTAERHGVFNSLVASNLNSVAPDVAFRVIYGGTNVRLKFMERSNDIQFDAVVEDADWSDTNTWSTHEVPESYHAIKIENLVDSPGVPQRVGMDVPNAFVHELTVQDGSDKITVDIESGNRLSATTSVTIGSNGIVELHGGSLDTSIVTVQDGGLLAGNGTVGANIDLQSGTVRPGFSVGHLDVAGAYQQDTDGILLIDIAGTGANQFDTIDIDGVATLGGTLQINASSLPAVASGTLFPIMTAESVEGTFESVAATGNNNVYFRAKYSTVAGVATAFAEIKFRGDMDGDDDIDVHDRDLFALGLVSPSRYFAECGCNDYGQLGGDFSGNGRLDFEDIAGFSGASGMSAASIGAAMDFYSRNVPEPASGLLLCLGATSLLAARARRQRAGF